MKHFFLGLIVWFHFGLAWAQGLDPPLQKLNHRAFTPTDGAPSVAYALAQTSDGTLWIGSSTGLTRFDGVRFAPYPADGEDSLPSNDVGSLMATQDGGLWIGHVRGGVTFLREGRAMTYGEHDGFPPGTARDFALDHDGSIWASSSIGVARLNKGRWETDADSAKFHGAVRGFLIDREWTHWVASAEAVFARPRGEPHYREVARSAFILATNGALALAPNGDVWATGTRALIRIKGPSEDFAHRVVSVKTSDGRPAKMVSFDRQGNMWAADGAVLRRVQARELDRAGTLEAEAETLSPSDGLSHKEILSMLHDREGNVWLGTHNGLDRLSASNVMRYRPQCAPTAVAAGDLGSLWVTCRGEFETNQTRDGKVLSRHKSPEFSAAFRDSEQTVWLGGPRVLASVEKGRMHIRPLPERAGDLPVQALIRDANGALWVSLYSGIFRLHNDVWTEYGNVDALPRSGASAMVELSDKSLWFGYRDGRVARLKGETVQLFGTGQGLDVGSVMTLHAQGSELWIGGELGLARYDGAAFVSVKSFVPPLRGVSGLVRSQDGEIWLNHASGISRIPRLNVDEAIQVPEHRVSVQTFNYLDGIPGHAPILRPAPSALLGTDGRIWFARSSGLVSIDIDRPIRNALPPPVAIWALTSGDVRYPNRGTGIALPAHTSRLQIEYTAGSLTIAERVQFRHKLEGLDSEWQDAGGRREAVYTNLGAGSYRFRVIASNNDGIWNETGSSLEFTIAPAYYQTRWFYALCALAAALLLYGVYALRIAQLSRRFHASFEARVNERMRIARELHDTLLQSFQGLVLRLQTAHQLIPEGNGRRILAEGIDQAADAITEGRDAVQGLRAASTDAVDLAEAIRAVGQSLDNSQSLPGIQFGVEVQGRPRGLHPVVRDDAFRIAGEAVRNAYRHAQPKRIEVEVCYGARTLSVRVRDDGKGIEKSLARRGRDGHFGLQGMRERAKLIGGKLTLWTRLNAGTEIELTVPATRAYVVASAPNEMAEDVIDP